VYEEYWGLREKPFRKTPDPRFLFLNETYEEAVERLVFAVEEMELALLTGEVGSGKTLLTRALVDRVGDRYEVGMILNPRLPPRQFLRTTALELGIAEPRFHSNDLLEQIHERLLDLDRQGRAALLIVDEAHLVPGKATFEEVRLLTNFQLDDRNLIAIVLVGQPELRERLKHRTHRALTQRVGVSFHLRPLSVEDTRAYLSHRLAVAGASRPLFTDSAVRLLHGASLGVPRLLNHLATQALIEAMARGALEVDGEAVGAVVDDDFATEASRRGASSPPAPRRNSPAKTAGPAKTPRPGKASTQPALAGARR
jgi:type II secretory pathway predicted ATPase ExeA